MTPQDLPDHRLFPIGCMADCPPEISRAIEDELAQRMGETKRVTPLGYKRAPAPNKSAEIRRKNADDRRCQRAAMIGPDWKTTAEIAAIWGLTHKGASNALQSLYKHGLVSRSVQTINKTWGAVWAHNPTQEHKPERPRTRADYLAVLPRDGWAPTCDVADVVGIAQDGALRMLRKLEKAGQVEGRKAGMTRLCRRS